MGKKVIRASSWTCCSLYLALPKISHDGVLSWNAEKFSRGVYLVNVKAEQGL